MHRTKWIRITGLVMAVFFGTLLLISLSSQYLDPNEFWLPSLLGLAYIQLFVINCLIFALFVLFKRDYLWISLFFLVFGFTELPNHLQFNFESKARERSVKVYSLNVRNFDLYNWSENKKTRDRILKSINQSRADIVCLQEFFNTVDPAHDFITLDTIVKFKKQYHQHIEYTSVVKETEQWGIATFTSYPIAGQGSIRFEKGSNNVCIYTDVIIGEDTVRIYNVHLASVKFGQEDYKYIEEMSGTMDSEVEGFTSLSKKLRRAFRVRASQARKVREHMEDSPFPVILCGDFNDTPNSFTYRTLADGLNDSFRQKGSGLGATYNGKISFLRIDYVLSDLDIDVLKHEVIHTDISDHFPLLVHLELSD